MLRNICLPFFWLRIVEKGVDGSWQTKGIGDQGFTDGPTECPVPCKACSDCLQFFSLPSVREGLSTALAYHCVGILDKDAGAFLLPDYLLSTAGNILEAVIQGHEWFGMLQIYLATYAVPMVCEDAESGLRLWQLVGKLLVCALPETKRHRRLDSGQFFCLV